MSATEAATDAAAHAHADAAALVAEHRAALELEHSKSLRMLQASLDEHLARFPPALLQQVTLRVFLETYDGSLDKYLGRSRSVPATGEAPAAGASSAPPSPGPVAAPAACAETLADDAPAKRQRGRKARPAKAKTTAAAAAIALMDSPAACDDDGVQQADDAGTARESEAGADAEAEADTQAQAEDGTSVVETVPSAPRATHTRSRAATIMAAAPASLAPTAGDASTVPDSSTSAKRSRRVGAQTAKTQEQVATAADDADDATDKQPPATTAKPRQSTRAAHAAVHPSKPRSPVRRSTRSQSIMVSAQPALQPPPTPAFSHLLPQTPAALRLRRPRPNEPLLSSNGSPIVNPFASTASASASASAFDDGDDGDAASDSTMDNGRVRDSFAGRRRITLRSASMAVDAHLAVAAKPRVAKKGGGGGGAPAKAARKPRKTARATAVGGDGGGTHETKNPLLMMQLGDGTVLDFDAAVSGAVINQQLGDAQRKEVAEQIRSVQAHLATLLGDMGL
ncbi:hypothetical protein BC831DRAFT_440813 [Entophlyctis helioformis]|nr:hypothetical protein BC831DRAFT_440813 [Entophlyctis helioformis]